MMMLLKMMMIIFVFLKIHQKIGVTEFKFCFCSHLLPLKATVLKFNIMKRHRNGFKLL